MVRFLTFQEYRQICWNTSGSSVQSSWSTVIWRRAQLSARRRRWSTRPAEAAEDAANTERMRLRSFFVFRHVGLEKVLCVTVILAFFLCILSPALFSSLQLYRPISYFSSEANDAAENQAGAERVQFSEKLGKIPTILQRSDHLVMQDTGRGFGCYGSITSNQGEKVLLQLDSAEGSGVRQTLAAERLCGVKMNCTNIRPPSWGALFGNLAFYSPFKRYQLMNLASCRLL